MVKWLRLMFEHAMTHVCPYELSGALINEMVERGCPVQDLVAAYSRETAVSLGGNPRVIDGWAFDAGGMAIQDEPAITIDIDGLAVKVWCGQYDYIVREFGRAPLRKFANGAPYHKLKYWHHATVLTPAQYAETFSKLQQRAPEAALRHSEFVADYRKKYPAYGS